MIARIRLFVVVSASALVAAPAASAHNGEQLVGWLNEQRAAHGLPELQHNAEWSRRCELHNEYTKQNGLTHYQQPDKPGYTVEGAWAGARSVLSSGTWTQPRNVFEFAPIHLMQMLGPHLAEAGGDGTNGGTCFTTWPGYDWSRFAGDPERVFTYPGNGSSNWRVSEEAYESPYVPGDFVGLPEGTTTGPHLYVFTAGPWEAVSRWGDYLITSASLIDGDGKQVEVRAIDDRYEIGGYLPPGGILIPVKPLCGDTRYTASVTVGHGSETISHTWNFTTRTASSLRSARAVGTGTVEIELACEDAVYFRAARRLLGAWHRGRCVPRRSVARQRRCTFYEVPARSRTPLVLPAGKSTVNLRQVFVRRLPAGRYRLTVYTSGGKRTLFVRVR